MKKLVVFDIDGTVLDSIGFFKNAIADYSISRGMPVPCLDTIERGYGDPHNHDFKWGVPREEQLHHLQQIWTVYDQLSNDANHTPELYPGVPETLAALEEAGHFLAIVTSKPEESLLHALKHHGIDRRFRACRNRADIQRRGEREKPYPDMLVSVIKETGFAPEDTVMIGDTVMDIAMGIGAGTHTIGVTWGAHRRADLEGAGAHCISDQGFAELARLILES